jgi:hypothetical protein
LVIGAEFGRKDYGSIPAAAIGRGLKPLDAKTDPPNQIKLGVKIKKKWNKQLHMIA